MWYVRCGGGWWLGVAAASIVSLLLLFIVIIYTPQLPLLFPVVNRASCIVHRAWCVSCGRIELELAKATTICNSQLFGFGLCFLHGSRLSRMRITLVQNGHHRQKQETSLCTTPHLTWLTSWLPSILDCWRLSAAVHAGRCALCVMRVLVCPFFSTSSGNSVWVPLSDAGKFSLPTSSSK